MTAWRSFFLLLFPPGLTSKIYLLKFFHSVSTPPDVDSIHPLPHPTPQLVPPPPFFPPTPFLPLLLAKSLKVDLWVPQCCTDPRLRNRLKPGELAQTALGGGRGGGRVHSKALSPVCLPVCVTVCPNTPNLASPVPGTLDVNRGRNGFGTQGGCGGGSRDGLPHLSFPGMESLLVLFPILACSHPTQGTVWERSRPGGAGVQLAGSPLPHSPFTSCL